LFLTLGIFTTKGIKKITKNNNNSQICKAPYTKLQRRQRRSQSGGIIAELQCKTSPGRLFQMNGAEYEYERLATSVFVLGIVSSGSAVDRV